MGGIGGASQRSARARGQDPISCGDQPPIRLAHALPHWSLPLAPWMPAGGTLTRSSVLEQYSTGARLCNVKFATLRLFTRSAAAGTATRLVLARRVLDCHTDSQSAAGDAMPQHAPGSARQPA